MSGWSARGSSRCGSLHHHSTRYSSRQRTKQGSGPSRRRERPARTTPRSGFRRWLPAGPMPLPVQRPANAIASIAVRRCQPVSGSSIRRPRHPWGRGNRHAPSPACSGRGSERARGLTSRRASAPLRRRSHGGSGDGRVQSSPECCSLALLGTRLFVSSDRRAQSTHRRALAPTTDAYVPAPRPASAFPRPRIRPSPEPRAGRSRTRNGARARERNTAPAAVVAAPPAHQSGASVPSATAAAPSARGQFAYLGQ